MVKLRHILDSITFRLALIYTLIFGVSVGGLFYFVFWTTAGFADQQMQAAINADINGFADSYQRAGMLALINSINHAVDPSNSAFTRDGIYLLVDPLGRRMAGNLQSWPQNAVHQDVWLDFTINDLRGAKPSAADVRAKQSLIPIGPDPRSYPRLLVGRDVRSANQFRVRLLNSLYMGLALTLALGILGGFLFSRTVVRRIESITRTCRRIMSGDLTQRVPVARRNDELSELSSSINNMLDQIERLMHGMQQVSDNIAHDLRTPLTRLRSRLETVLRHLKDPGERDNIEGALADAESLLSTFAALLRIARAEAGVQGNFTEIDLHAIAEDVVDLYGPLAEEKGLVFVSRLEAGLVARGDPNLVAQALANIVDNAIKYTPSGEITLALTMQGDQPAFIVADNGPGIPDEFKSKVLERLFRMERSRTSPGSGLGLSLTAAVARSHGMELKLDDNRPGLKITLRFPRRARELPKGPTGKPKLLAGPDHAHDHAGDVAPPAAAA